MPQDRQPVVFLYERRKEFNNHAYIFSGPKLTKQIRLALKRARYRAQLE